MACSGCARRRKAMKEKAEKAKKAIIKKVKK